MSTTLFFRSSGGKHKEMSHLLNRLIDNQRYDSRIRPNYGGKLLNPGA